MKMSVFVGTSVDGFLARTTDELDFLDEGGGTPHGYEEFIAQIDTILIGRRTYDKILTFPDWPYTDKRIVVLSHNPIPAPPGGNKVEHMSGSPEEIAAQLASTGSQHVYVDGGVTVQGFLRAGLVQRITVSRVPVLIGDGIPLFGSLLRDIRLRHLATQAYAGGLVKTEYEVIP